MKMNTDVAVASTTSDQLGHAREHVSLLGAQQHMDAVNAALDALPRALDLLAECERTLEMWADVAPAVSLRADIRKFLASAQ
jgi:1,2-phenylacetyl-CoA epoxidase catalytic subunit